MGSSTGESAVGERCPNERGAGAERLLMRLDAWIYPETADQRQALADAAAALGQGGAGRDGQPNLEPDGRARLRLAGRLAAAGRCRGGGPQRTGRQGGPPGARVRHRPRAGGGRQVAPRPSERQDVDLRPCCRVTTGGGWPRRTPTSSWGSRVPARNCSGSWRRAAASTGGSCGRSTSRFSKCLERPRGWRSGV